MGSVVTIALGRIQGMEKENHLEFLGIRYAKAPVGNLRYAEPLPVDSWDDVYDATKYAPIAPQVWQDDPKIELEESEDCLFLNVYTPAVDNQKRPVMFYIHGGAYGIGSGSRPRLYGGNLSECGNVVVVTIQYRLGPFGFLYMDGIPTNLGLKDQICALRWVQDNITAFGGDPNNITIFGQSAGSISVSYLLIMPEAEGLFSKAIAQSATFPLEPSTPEKASKITEAFLSKLDITPGDVNELRKLSWEQIIQVQSKIAKDILSDKHHGPVLDGVSIPNNPIHSLLTGFGKNIPLMIGHTSDEVPVFQGFINSKNIVVRYLAKRLISKRLVDFGIRKQDLQKALRLYREQLNESDIPNKEFDQLVTDMGFRLPSIIVADAHCTGKAGTYFYEFAYKAPNLGVAVHVLDLFFVFGTLDTTDISEAMRLSQSSEEKHLSEIIMDTWINFARTGNPNHAKIPNWIQYDSDSRATMILDIEPKLVANHLESRIKIWKSLSLL